MSTLRDKAIEALLSGVIADQSTSWLSNMPRALRFRHGQLEIGGDWSSIDLQQLVNELVPLAIEECAQIADGRVHPNDPECVICKIAAEIRGLNEEETK